MPFLAVVLALLFAGCATIPPPESTPNPEPPIINPHQPPANPLSFQSPAADNVALSVDGQAVSLDEVRQWWLDYAKDRNFTPEDLEREQRQFFQSIITQSILVRAARDAAADKEPEFQSRLRPTYRSLLAEFFIERYVTAGITVSNEEIEQYYDANKLEFDDPPTISVRFILTPTRDESMKALAELQAGKPFDEVARTFSTHPTALKGGVLPPFAQGSYDADFERVAWSLKVGEMSGVVFTDIGYCIIEKTGQTDAIVAPLSAVSSQIKDKLLSEKRQQRLEEYLEQKRQTFDIYINTRVYDVLATPTPMP